MVIDAYPGQNLAGRQKCPRVVVDEAGLVHKELEQLAVIGVTVATVGNFTLISPASSMTTIDTG